MTVWISALIPRKGADTYGGVRLQVSSSEQKCYQDLAAWLCDEDIIGKNPTKKKIIERLDSEVENSEILLWKVEKQEL